MTLRLLLRVSSIFRTSNSRFYKHSAKMQHTSQNTNLAYFRYVEGTEQFQVSFQLKNETLGIDRQFNFSRQISEKVNYFLSRVSANVEKNLSKKKRKKKKDADTETEESNKLEVRLLQNGEPISGDEVCKNVLFANGLALSVNGSELKVIMNAPWINVITLPTSIMAGFPVYPLKLDILFAKKEDCKFAWYKGDDTKKKSEEDSWTEVGSGYYYTPNVQDIGYKLKLCCVPQRDGIEGQKIEVVSTNPVEAGPGYCPFELRHAFTTERLPSGSFRVVSYNILADLYADSDVARKQLFPYCPPYALSIDYRKQLILKELLGYNADLMCLQEVDSKVFDLDLVPILSSAGFEGIFHKKAGQVSEGLACFFHKSKFRCIKSHSIILGEEIQSNPIFSDMWNKIKVNEQLVRRVVDRSTCTQVVVLESVDKPQERIVIGNTHQYFHPDADHVRLLQAGVTVMFLEQMVAETSAKEPNKNVSFILCGDFNSTPEFGVYRLMTTQNIPDDHMDWSSNKEEEVKGVSLTHSLPLASACGTPAFTNYTVGFAGCLDYIFYHREHLCVQQVVPLPSEEEMKQHLGLPSIVFPSDHVALVATLSWIKPSPRS